MAQLEGADLISLEPWTKSTAPGERLKGNLILGATKLSRDDARAAAAVISSAVGSFNGMVAACFDPRHALRFTSAGHGYLVLVCFDCGSLQVFEDGRQIGSAALTGSPAALNKMLAAANVPISHSAEELAAETEREQETNGRRWRAGMPSSVRPLWNDQFMGGGDDLRGLRAALSKEYPKTPDRIRALLGWYGSGSGPWSGFPSYKAVAQELLFDFKTDEVIGAVAGHDLSEAQLEGAARFFADWEFGQRRPKDQDRLPPDLRQRLLAHSLESDDNDKRARAKRAFVGRRS